MTDKKITYYDEEEKEFVESFNEALDRGEPLKSVFTEEEKQRFQQIAKNTINDEKKKISIRVSKTDLLRIKAKAMQEGLPYQTLINSVLHKYVSS